MTRDEQRISDILAAIGRVDDVVDQGRVALDASHVLQAAVLYNIQIIGEAASGLSDEARAMHEAVPWREIVAMRNRIVHRYFDIDLDLVWETITRDLRALRSMLHRPEDVAE